MDDVPALSEASPSHPRSAQKHRRAYKACVSCRRRKAKCDLGGRDGPPCVKCRRELRECVFPRERAWSKQLNASSAIASPPGPPGASYAAPVHASPSGAGPSAPLDGNENRSNLVRSVVKAVVSNGNDALDLLFEAATRRDLNTPASPQTPANTSAAAAPTSVENEQAFDAIKLWETSKFVKRFWMSSADVVEYIDFFVGYMAPLTPVVAFHNNDYEACHRFVSSEPLLCCVILMIASRYHTLPGQGSVSRGHFIHERMWKSCQQLITRLIFGQERGPVKRTRSLGSVEALLLMTEWHQRALHFPPETDGWESDSILLDTDDVSKNRSPNTWIQDVIEPSRRSDRTSWMIIGMAVSLAYELNVFSDDLVSTSVSPDVAARSGRIRKVLVIFSNQIASRFGCTATLPLNISRAAKMATDQGALSAHPWDAAVNAWMDLTRLLKSMSEMIFPSRSHFFDLLRTGRHSTLLDHFELLLSQWEGSHLSANGLSGVQRDILCIEHQYVRICCYSVGMQAICERAFSDAATETAARATVISSLDDGEIRPIQEVIDSCCIVLETCARLAEGESLRLCPVRVYLRIITASIFLLKAVGIGARNSRLRAALALLDSTVQVLRSKAPDDVHLTTRYADLLELHISTLRSNLSSFLKQTMPARSNPDMGPSAPDLETDDNFVGGQGRPEIMPSAAELDSIFDGLSTDDFVSLPFDPIMAPLFPVGDLDSDATANIPGVEGDGLSLLWNFPI